MSTYWCFSVVAADRKTVRDPAGLVAAAGVVDVVLMAGYASAAEPSETHSSFGFREVISFEQGLCCVIGCLFFQLFHFKLLFCSLRLERELSESCLRV